MGTFGAIAFRWMLADPTDYNITMTSEWERWRLKSPASPLFTQTFIRA